MNCSASDLSNISVETQGDGDIRPSDSVQQMQLELQAYKDKCKTYEEEIRLVLQEFPSSGEDLQKQRRLMEVIEENQFLQACLAKAKKHVLRSKVKLTENSSNPRRIPLACQVHVGNLE